MYMIFFVCAWSIPLLMHVRRIQNIFVSTSRCGLLLKLPVSRCRMHPSLTTEWQTYSRLRVLFSAPFTVCLPCICLFLISRGTFSSLCSRFRSPLPLLPVDYCTPPRKSIIAIMTATSGIRIPLSDAITMDTGKLHGAPACRNSGLQVEVETKSPTPNVRFRNGLRPIESPDFNIPGALLASVDSAIPRSPWTQEAHPVTAPAGEKPISAHQDAGANHVR